MILDAVHLLLTIGVVAASIAYFAERGRRQRTERALETASSESAAAAGERSQLLVKVAELSTKLEAEQASAAEKIRLLESAGEQLSRQFEALSKEALQSNNSIFIDLAKTNFEKYQETARGDLEKRQQAIVELVQPLKESLTKVDTKISEIEKQRAQEYGSLGEQVKQLLASGAQLTQETANLARALRSPVARGRWGELQLRRVVEMAGMLNYCDFCEQESRDSETGRLRPDVVIKLPNERQVIVDAKAPLDAYLDAASLQDETLRAARLRDFARHVRTHVTQLGLKQYWEQFQPSPDFVVLFLPGEPFFSTALEQDPALIEFGVQQRVIIATPTTLIALLRAVAYGWQQQQLAENAKEVSALGKQLYDRFAMVGDGLFKLRKSLTSTVENYNNLVGSLERRLLVSARKFKELGVVSESEIPEMQQIETIPLAPQSAELSVSAIAIESQELLSTKESQN